MPLTVIMLDIDYFKSINDVYGHQFGDLILKQFALQLKKMVRKYDIVIRYGGEEFIIISAGIDRNQALTFSQRILGALNLYTFGNKKHYIKLKISHIKTNITGLIPVLNFFISKKSHNPSKIKK